MNTQPGEVTHGYLLEQWTQHWRLVDGAWYRDAIAVRLADGQRRLVSFPDREA